MIVDKDLFKKLIFKLKKIFKRNIYISATVTEEIKFFCPKI